MTHDPDCEKCEELLQGYLDRDLTSEEVLIAEGHLEDCDYCRRRYRFEAQLRRYIRISASERMPAGLLAKLAQLRGPTADGPLRSTRGRAAVRRSRPGDSGWSRRGAGG